MIEIKFRAFVKGKGMFYFTIDELLSSTVHSEGVTYSGGSMTYVWEKGEKMQYTGLKDKNGKEIYRGDIIKTSGGHIFEIEWNDSWGAWMIGGLKHMIMELPDGSSIPIYTYSEVIGNIYENPELI